MEPILYDPKLHSHLIPSLVAIHVACITQPTYTIATFLPPLNQALMQSWWEARAQEVVDRTRHIIMQKALNPTTGKEEVAGYVMLSMPSSQTIAFVGTVEKLLVPPQHRNKGIAKRLMAKLEEVARKDRRLLLTLDTEKGSLAELLYPKLGYVKIGEVPAFMTSPFDGSLKDGVFFYKDMR